MSKRTRRLAAELLGQTASIRAVKSGSDQNNPFTKVFADLERWAQGEGITLTLVGGIGAIYHGYQAMTQDVDVAVPAKDMEALLQTATKYNFKVAWQSKLGWHTLEHHPTGMEINIVPEGGRPEGRKEGSPYVIPNPEKLEAPRGFGYAGFSGWVMLKLMSFREKDKLHLTEVLKKAGPEKLVQVKEYLGTTPYADSLLARLSEILKRVEDEKAADSDRDFRSL